MSGSRKAAIERHCRNCIYDPVGGSGTWREQTQACTNKTCDLWQFRPTPYQSTPSELNALTFSESREIHLSLASEV